MATDIFNTTRILTGDEVGHLLQLNERIFIHKEMLDPWERLCGSALASGIELRITSGFRSYDGQLAIWNAKCDGTKPILDIQGHALDVSKLSAKEVVYGILRWSALPGLSRHHWGTDIDVYDARALPLDYKVRLVPEEATGVFVKLAEWLKPNLSTHKFFRPYNTDKNGVGPEWWHLSYGPLAQQYFTSHRKAILVERLERSEMRHKAIVLKELDAIWERYFVNIDSA